MIKLPPECPRGRSDCQPLAQIRADDGGTFLCVGENDGTTRTVEQDCFRHCVRSETTDEIHDCDARDLADQCSVLAQALSVIANVEANRKAEAGPGVVMGVPVADVSAVTEAEAAAMQENLDQQVRQHRRGAGCKISDPD